MRTTIARAATAALAASLLLAVAAGAAAATTRTAGAAQRAAATPVETAPATKNLASLTWLVSPYPPSSIDPVKYNDYPEDIIVPNMCESLVRQVPGMRTVPDLAQSWSTPNPLTLVFSLRHGVTFWDGKPMTAADVVYSLERNLDPKSQSIYATYFGNVKSIEATDASTVTIHFKTPDAMLLPELATLGGAVVEPGYVKREGAKFGTPAGGVMCTGPFKFKSWNGTSQLVMVRNDHYWNKALRPKVKEMTFVWPTDPSQISSGFRTGAFGGGFFLNATAIPLLKASSAGKLYIGPDSQTMAVMALIVVGTKGAIANPVVRRALNLSIDRAALIKIAESGVGTPGYADASPGYFSYQRSRYAAAYAAFQKAGSDPAMAKTLVGKAGADAKKPIVLAIPAGVQEIADVGQVVQQSANAAGLHVTLKTVPLDQYGALFSDPSARKGTDLIFTINYDQDPDPLAVYTDIAAPHGISNFAGYDNKTVTRLLTQARMTTNLAKRARLVIAAQKLVMRDLPWIPLDFRPNTTFVRNGVCGVPLDFSAMTSPWAASVGGC